MKTLEIAARQRTQTGKKESKKIRNEGSVPCVMYGGKEIKHFYSHENNFKDLVFSPDVYAVALNIDGTKHKAVIKDIQFHPVSDKIIHIDFIEIFDDKPVTVAIPVNLVGESAGLKAGGKLRLKRRRLTARGLINDLPDHLNIDITNLDVGQTIKVNELNYENIEILDPGRAMVVAVISSRLAMKGMEITEEAPEGEEAGEGDEGEEAGKQEEVKEEGENS